MKEFIENEDLKTNEKWLQGELEQRLIEIRKRVKDLYKAKETISQVKHFTPHGEPHCQAVEDLLYRLIPGELHKKLSEIEKFFLLASAWLHDIGMLKGILGDNDDTISDEELRDNHHSRSEEYIIKNYIQLGVLEYEKEAFGILARFHRRRIPLEDCSADIQIHGHHLQLNLLAAYLRLADALHIDQTRAPDVQYAISLAYDIPNSDKEHWLKSKFVLGIEIDPEKKEITVHLKRPTDKNSDQSENWVDTLNIIYDQIVQDLNSELESVKNVLISAGITYFLSIKKKIHKVEFDKQMRNDYKNVFKQYDLLDNPSSSALSKLVLQSINGILDSKECDVSPASLNVIKSFLVEVEERILISRKCHSGLRNLVDEIRSKVEKGNIKDLKFFIKYRLWIIEQKSKAVRFSAYRYFTKILAELNRNKKKVENSKKLLEEMIRDEKKFNILLYGYSELAIKCLCGFRDAIINQMRSDFNEEHKEKIIDYDPLFSQKDEQKIFENIEKEGDLVKQIKLKNKYDRLLLIHYEKEWEERAANYFRIFICEGQPKNRTSWGGHIYYHDGAQYALRISSNGFSNIFIIPDATAASLIVPYNQCPGFPKIDYVLVGANGYNNEIFRHSAGHASVSTVTSFSRAIKNTGYNEYLDNSDLDKTKPELPVLILTLTTDKYDRAEIEKEKNANDDWETIDKKDNTQVTNDCNKKITDKKDNAAIISDGWLFQGSFAGEDKRTHVFISQDTDLRKKLESRKIRFYNPREDKIPIKLVDVVITEKAWIEKKENKNWDGSLITNTVKDNDYKDIEKTKTSSDNTAINEDQRNP